MLNLAQQIVQVREAGTEVVLVSSGAMQAGRERLGIEPRANAKTSLPEKQMLAAVGQTHLMLAWEQVFGMFDTQVAQVLLTRADLSDRRRYLNARDALRAILARGIVPIINENDAVATEEIRVGDNDNLSALTANVLNADVLLILSDIDGLFTADPRKDPKAKLIEDVREIDDSVRALATGSKTDLGVGGMSTRSRPPSWLRVVAHSSSSRMGHAPMSLPMQCRAAQWAPLSPTGNPHRKPQTLDLTSAPSARPPPTMGPYVRSEAARVCCR